MKIIAIAGISGSGKSTISHHLKSLLGSDKTSLISIDNYYTDLSNLTPSERNSHNFDHPDAIDLNHLIADLRFLNQGKTVELPHYDFNTHTRTKQTTKQRPLPYLILEGLFALHYQQLKPFIHLSVYIELSNQIALERRIQRDCIERNRSETDILKQFNATVKPSILKYISPSAQHANLIVSGIDDPLANAVKIQQHINGLKL